MPVKTDFEVRGTVRWAARAGIEICIKIISRNICQNYSWNQFTLMIWEKKCNSSDGNPAHFTHSIHPWNRLIGITKINYTKNLNTTLKIYFQGRNFLQLSKRRTSTAMRKPRSVDVSAGKTFRRRRASSYRREAKQPFPNLGMASQNVLQKRRGQYEKRMPVRLRRLVLRLFICYRPDDTTVKCVSLD